jgi:hypothetical protein
MKKSLMSSVHRAFGLCDSRTGFHYYAEENMRADRVEFSWDKNKSNWVIRIVAGEEVIQRHCELPENSDPQSLQTAIEKTVSDEGLEVDRTSVVRV